jgi:DNA-binding transcriptional MerR regulator
MKVAEVAQRAGVGAHAVRFYVRAGLLQAGRDPSNNYKQFGDAHVLRLRFIKGAQALGFSLAEIRALLARMDSGECTCDAMHLQLADKILDLRRQIEALEERHAFMQHAYDDWQAGTGGPHDLGRLCRYLKDRAGSEARRSPADQGRLAAPGERGSAIRKQHRIGSTASSQTSGKRLPALESKSCAPKDSAGHRGTAGRRAEGGLAVQDLLSRDWCSAP